MFDYSFVVVECNVVCECGYSAPSARPKLDRDRLQDADGAQVRLMRLVPGRFSCRRGSI